MEEINAKYIYDAATDFQVASEILGNEFGKRISPLRSTIVTLALSAELHIKCLLNLIGKKDVRSHRIKKLYKELNSEIREKIASYYMQDPPKKTIDEVLIEINTIFVDWRYIYEKQDKPFFINIELLRQFVTALNKTVIELKPEWE